MHEVASMGLNLDEQKAVDRFRTTVVEPSRSKLVILDFWAEWCGPCKALAPVLEKVAGEYADKGVELVKLNVDEEQFIAAQFQVRSIPTVYAIYQGQPVADLTPARTESQLRQMLDQLLEQLPVGEAAQQAEIAPLVAMGEQVLADGDGERAAGIFAQIVEMAPEDPGVQSGLIRALIAAGLNDEAQAALDALPETLRNDPLVAQAGSTLALAASGVDAGELQALRAAAAELQLRRVAKERGVAEDRVRALVSAHTQPPFLGILGRQRVNVLELNLALDQELGDVR